MSESLCLNLLQLSAVQELANIGLGRAAMALGELTGQTYIMGIPHVQEVGMEAVPGLLADGDSLYAAAYTPAVGDFNGHLAFLFDWASVQQLCILLVGAAPESFEDVSELHLSVITEIGNILNGSFLNAICEMTGITVHLQPPLACIDYGVSILSSIAVEAELTNAMALSVDTGLESIGDIQLKGSFLLIPGEGGLSRLFSALGLQEAA
jgi:chemotaxis protein CheC